MGRKADSGGRHISSERQRKFSDPIHSSYLHMKKLKQGTCSPSLATFSEERKSESVSQGRFCGFST